jgi:hypothetical protein
MGALSDPQAPPERLTIATCIGCGAMSRPSECARGCGAEQKLELVAGADLDELIDLELASEQRAQALGAIMKRFLAAQSGQPAAELLGQARATLRVHEHESPALAAALAAEPDPIVAWWCPDCGGLDAPAPCLGVCVRRPAQWARLETLMGKRDSAALVLGLERRCARAVRALACTRPQPGHEGRHRQALREHAAQALAGYST